MLVSNVTINTYSKIGYLWNAFKNQILQPKADQWNWSATLHTSSYILYKNDPPPLGWSLTIHSEILVDQ